MKAELFLKTKSPVEHLEIEKLLAASDTFPYWTFWYPEKDGEQRVRFIRADQVVEVNLIGEVAEETSNLTVLRGGKDG